LVIAHCLASIPSCEPDCRLPEVGGFHLWRAGLAVDLVCRISLNHALNSFGTGYAQQTSLTLNGTTTANAAYSPSSGFGFAPLKLGRRLLEVSAKFTF